MERKNRITWLIGILAVLIVIAYVSGVFDRAPSTVDVPDVDIDGAAVERLAIEGGDLSLEVKKSNGVWQMTRPVAWLADSVAVSSFIRNLSDLTLESVVSRNPERYGRYGVDSTGSKLTVDLPDGSRQLVFGSEGPDFSTVYVRLLGDERVFKARPHLQGPSDAGIWRDKRVTNVPAENITKVGVKTPESEWSMTKGPEGWLFDGDDTRASADSAAVAGWLRNFAPFRADGFLPLETEMDGAAHIITLQLTGGDTVNFLIQERENDLALRYDREPGAVFKLYKSRQSSLIPDRLSLAASE